MNLPQRNNNPVNLKFAGQTEATGPDPAGFAVFLTPMAGWRAAHAQIELDQSRDLTLAQFIFKFAPPNENNSNEYLEFVAGEMDCPLEQKIASLSKYALAGVMAQMEGYYVK